MDNESSRKTLHQGGPPILGTLEKHVMKEVEELRNCMVPVNGSLVKLLALKEASNNNIEFVASAGWMAHFKLGLGLDNLCQPKSYNK